MAESFFATLKSELGDRWPDRDTARGEVFAWLHHFNHRRRHSTIGMLAPADYEERLACQPAPTPATDLASAA